MAVLPQFPPAESDASISVVIPAALVPYLGLIHSSVAPDKNLGEWISSVIIDRLASSLKDIMSRQVASDMLKLKNEELNQEISNLIGG